MNPVEGLPELLGGRLSLRRRLGAGAFGTVYEAIDARFGGRVAVKVLARDQSQAIYRFKREFRSLAELVHPNLVRLYELFATDDVFCFTMELVEGRDFLAHVMNAPSTIAPTITVDVTDRPAPAAGSAPARPPRVVDVDLLRAAFLQLARGVHAVHEAGKLHCDIKPSNVLVSDEGRVVLLDFGLVADLDGRDQRDRGPMGTPGYMAPEQARGEALTPAVDWYSFGAMLHEALTGELPDRRSPIEHDPGDELAALCGELIAESPGARPSGIDVLARLGDRTASMSAPSRPRLFGRAAELQALRDAWTSVAETGAVVVRVVGNSGIGKTSLVETFLDELSGSQLVLRGRCYEQESVPYKAVDTVVDALAEYLRRLGPALADVVPENASLLGRLFPVLRDTLRVAEEREELDSQEQRRRAFVALRDLLARVGRDRPIVCFLDDLQWGDVDSAHLLSEIMRPPDAPRILVIAGHRPDPTAAFLSRFADLSVSTRVRTIELEDLSPDDAIALADHLLVPRETVKASEIVREAAGNPLFIQQLAVRANSIGDSDHHLGLAELILSQVQAMDPAARQLVETVALAGQPIDETIAVRAAALDATSSREATLSVRHARLITARTQGATIVLEPAHDRVRETLVAALAPEAARGGHRRIAEALIELSQPDPERLVHHYRGAGDDPRTREFAIIAADRADEAFAFDRAASFRGLVLELTSETPDRWQLLERYGSSLANAGRAIAAADAYEGAANALESTGSDPERATKVHMQRRRAGELTLRSGHLVRGAQRMERVLRDVGVTLPGSRTKAAWLAAGRRMKLFVRGIEPRRNARSSAAGRLRLDALWSASTGMAQMNHVVGDALGLQYLLEALELGERSSMIRGLGLESVFEAVIGGAFFRRRCERFLSAMDRLAEESGDPYDRAWAAASRGGAAWFHGDWEACFKFTDDAIRIYREHCRGVSWEIALCEAYRLPGLASLGDLVRLAEIVPRAYAAARERGDLFAANTLRLGQQSLTLLVADHAQEAIDEANAAIEPFPRETYLGPHYHHLYAVAQAELYRGRPLIAWTAIGEAWREIEQAKFLLAQSLRIEIRHLRSRAALATAVERPSEASSLHAIALRDAAKIAKDDVPCAAPISSAIRAGVAATRGQTDRAIAELSLAAAGFERAKMALYLHATKDRLGHVLGGTDGARLRQTAAAWMASQHIVRPEAITRMLIPGV